MFFQLLLISIVLFNNLSESYKTDNVRTPNIFSNNMFDFMFEILKLVATSSDFWIPWFSGDN